MADNKGSAFNEMLEKAKEFRLDDLNNIDWENMGSWPLPGKVIFCLLLFIGVLVGGYFALIADNIDLLQREQAREISLKKEFEGKAYSVANLAPLKEQMAEMEESFGSLLKQLPRDTEVPGLIDDISSAALSAGLSLKAINPQDMVQKEFYKELPIEIEVEGGYHEMGGFVSAVASLPRIVTLHDFSIVKQGDDGSLKMEITAKTYQYNPDREDAR
ncbi:MAG: pilus assembly protein PilP [Oceanospirillaceae bacterium]|nr:pilus assembly protein PilP [Oceanospirillaceae bacterium]MBT11690.1 pilus assembly protein PilP [Oceanospirillaceae bacterium]|tara:strand:+ start:2712 stop:3359 length:648 start_codon:yes stop_codon:yes gene_type:complete